MSIVAIFHSDESGMVTVPADIASFLISMWLEMAAKARQQISNMCGGDVAGNAD